MKLKVAFSELNVTGNMVPLASGYLQTYASLDEEIKNNYTFSMSSGSSQTPRAELLWQLLSQEADVYAFSCYVWNMKLVRYLVTQVHEHRPQAAIIMGGPQVDGHASCYIDPSWDNVYVCNKEGERPFRDFLLAYSGGADMRSVAGLSFFRDRVLVDTPLSKGLEDLNSIPSPFLSGIYPGSYSSAIWETNRGCPYLCTFCYWGKGEDTSIRKFDTERLHAELEWMARHSILYIHVADANWGIFPRDVELSQEIVRWKQKFGAPAMVAFSSAKNRADRATEIAEVLYAGGIISSRPVGLQSMTKAVLKNIKRKNIDLEILAPAGAQMEGGVSTYPELIWPLPGETLESFKKGLTDVCNRGFTSMLIFPALLLHATEMERQVEEFGIQTVEADDDISELQVITATRDVTPQETDDGFWLSFGIHCLYNSRTLRTVGRYLNDRGILPWGELFWSFVQFFRSGSTAIAAHWNQVVTQRTHAEYWAVGELIHTILHQTRREYQKWLIEFARSQSWWSDEQARVLFEVDLVNCPYVYSNTEFAPVPDCIALKYLRVTALEGRKARVQLKPEFASLVSQYVLGPGKPASDLFEVAYQIKQYPFMPVKSMRDNYNYAYGAVLRGSIIAAQWKDIADPQLSAVAGRTADAAKGAASA